MGKEKITKDILAVKIGIVAVRRDCFPESLSVNRRKVLFEVFKRLGADKIGYNQKEKYATENSF